MFVMAMATPTKNMERYIVVRSLICIPFFASIRINFFQLYNSTFSLPWARRRHRRRLRQRLFVALQWFNFFFRILYVVHWPLIFYQKWYLCAGHIHLPVNHMQSKLNGNICIFNAICVTKYVHFSEICLKEFNW